LSITFFEQLSAPGQQIPLHVVQVPFVHFWALPLQPFGSIFPS